MTTPIDRESVEVLAQIFSQERDAFTAKTLLALRAALDAAEGEVRKWQANHDTWQATALSAEAESKRLREALQSIASNTCCDTCQEAALVARAALQENPDG